MPETNLFLALESFYSFLGEQPSRTRASLPTLSEQLAPNHLGAGCSPALTPPAKRVKTKRSVSTTWSKKYTSTRIIRLLTVKSLWASFSFSSCGEVLPGETREVLAYTTGAASVRGTSSILPTVFPWFWESRENLGLQKLVNQEKKEIGKKA